MRVTVVEADRRVRRPLDVVEQGGLPLVVGLAACVEGEVVERHRQSYEAVPQHR